MKFGFDWRLLHFNEGANNAPSELTPSHAGLRKGPIRAQASANSGYGFASFLLGTPASGSVIQINKMSTQGSYYAGYVQDDWKITDKLTVNMGMRWEVAVGNKEKYNQLAYFDPSAINHWSGCWAS